MKILDAPDNLVSLETAYTGWVRKDAEATAILGRCAEAARLSGRVVLKGVTSDEKPSPALLMMALVGGRDHPELP